MLKSSVRAQEMNNFWANFSSKVNLKKSEISFSHYSVDLFQENPAFEGISFIFHRISHNDSHCPSNSQTNVHISNFQVHVIAITNQHTSFEIFQVSHGNFPKVFILMENLWFGNFSLGKFQLFLSNFFVLI